MQDSHTGVTNWTNTRFEAALSPKDNDLAMTPALWTAEGFTEMPCEAVFWTRVPTDACGQHVFVVLGTNQKLSEQKNVGGKKQYVFLQALRNQRWSPVLSRQW